MPRDNAHDEQGDAEHPYREGLRENEEGAAKAADRVPPIEATRRDVARVVPRRTSLSGQRQHDYAKSKAADAEAHEGREIGALELPRKIRVDTGLESGENAPCHDDGDRPPRCTRRRAVRTVSLRRWIFCTHAPIVPRGTAAKN